MGAKKFFTLFLLAAVVAALQVAPMDNSSSGDMIIPTTVTTLDLTQYSGM
jgi:hypothetical protein